MNFPKEVAIIQIRINMRKKRELRPWKCTHPILCAGKVAVFTADFLVPPQR